MYELRTDGRRWLHRVGANALAAVYRGRDRYGNEVCYLIQRDVFDDLPPDRLDVNFVKALLDPDVTTNPVPPALTTTQLAEE